mgnify:CR=1 FL=1
MKGILIGMLLLAATIAPAKAEGDAGKGEQVFARCKACHDIDKGLNRLGPTMKGVVGRPVASVAEFKYSEAMLAKGAEGAVWDDASLAVYLADPKGFVPKTKMIFPGIKKPEEVADLISFLKTRP